MTHLIARFDSAAGLVGAVEKLQARTDLDLDLDAFTPYPVEEVVRLLGGPTAKVGWIAVLSALIGGLLTYAVIYWTAAIDYPLNIGARPLNSWPAFLPPVLVAAALWSGIATLIAMLYLAGLPKWHDPLFDVRQIDRATYDRFFLLVTGREGKEGEIRQILQGLGAEAIEELPA